MSLVIDAMQPSIVKGLLEVSGRLERGAIVDIILPMNKIGYDLDVDGECFVFDFRDTEILALSTAKDINRFSNAAFTTYNDVPSALNSAETIAWAMIKAYYSAFYAGHALLRATGQSCSNFEGSHVSNLKKNLAIRSLVPTSPVETGLYHLVFNEGQTGFSCRKAAGRSGGAHEVFWKIFGEYISGLSEATLLGHLAPDEARETAIKLDEFALLLKSNGSHSFNWLSNVRNQIQYQHLHGVWPAVSINKTQRAMLSRLASERYYDPMKITMDDRERNELKKFVTACAFMVSLCEAMIKRLVERADDRTKSFAKTPLQHCSKAELSTS